MTDPNMYGGSRSGKTFRNIMCLCDDCDGPGSLAGRCGDGKRRCALCSQRYSYELMLAALTSAERQLLAVSPGFEAVDE